jgi:hypothetical protein
MRARLDRRKPCALARRNAQAIGWNGSCSLPAAMKTIGDLVFALYAKYEQQYHDGKLAAVATQVALDELLRRCKRTSERKAA